MRIAFILLLLLTAVASQSQSAALLLNKQTLLEVYPKLATHSQYISKIDHLFAEFRHLQCQRSRTRMERGWRGDQHNRYSRGTYTLAYLSLCHQPSIRISNFHFHPHLQRLLVDSRRLPRWQCAHSSWLFPQKFIHWRHLSHPHLSQHFIKVIYQCIPPPGSWR